MDSQYGVRRLTAGGGRRSVIDKKGIGNDVQETSSQLTWVEFAERMKENPVILLPFGSQEEQGPQAPMGDYMLTDAIVARVAERTDAIAAPIIPFGYADYFRPIPGGIQLSAETFRALFEDICANFLDHGLDHLVVMNGHKGNYPLIDQSIRKLKRERGVWIPCLNLWRLMTPAQWAELHGERGTAALGHGGDPLTSAYQHLFPELMRMDLIEMKDKKPVLGLPPSGLNSVRFEGVDVHLAIDIDDICDTGIADGDPNNSSAEIGEKIVEYLVDFSAKFVTYFNGAESKT